MSARVVDAPERSRYELHADDGDDLLGFSDYRPAGESLIVSHTEIAEGNEGQGLGAQLARGTLDAIRERGLMVLPICPFTAAFIARHADEYTDLVHASMRKRFPRTRSS
jgi:uncharacterized protein